MEKQAAEYKLFRSLTVLFILDVPLTLIGDSYSPVRLTVTLLLACACFYRFAYLLNWTYRLAFEYFFHAEGRAAVAATNVR